MAVRVPAILDIREEAFCEVLRAAVAGSSELRLDAREVTRIDAAGLQLLVIAVLEVTRRGGVVHWDAPSATLIEGARISGLAATLGLSLEGL